MITCKIEPCITFESVDELLWCEYSFIRALEELRVLFWKQVKTGEGEAGMTGGEEKRKGKRPADEAYEKSQHPE